MNPLRNLIFNKVVGAVEDFFTDDRPKGRPAAGSAEKSNPKEDAPPKKEEKNNK